jgi:predicted DCC family thiol-disulfide oxidoreductase YuxK
MGEDRESGGVSPVLLFDGVCNLCNGAVRFVIERDPAGLFRFAPLQSERGRELLAGCALPLEGLDTMVLVEGGRCYTRSESALRIAARLSGGWPLLGVLRLVPRPLRDRAYGYLAANRYRWFGKSESCLAPTPELRARFL